MAPGISYQGPQKQLASRIWKLFLLGSTQAHKYQNVRREPSNQIIFSLNANICIGTKTKCVLSNKMAFCEQMNGNLFIQSLRHWNYILFFSKIIPLTPILFSEYYTCESVWVESNWPKAMKFIFWNELFIPLFNGYLCIHKHYQSI